MQAHWQNAAKFLFGLEVDDLAHMAQAAEH
jgi:hypothetical protein